MWNFDRNHDRLALIAQDGTEYTYRQLNKAQEALAKVVPRRCLVICLCENAVGSILGYTTFIKHRIVPLLLDAQLERRLLTQLIIRYQPDYLWIPDELVTEFFAVTSGDGNTTYKKTYADSGYSLLKTAYECSFPLNEELALLLTTSGSTGSPKMVRQSYRNIRANAESIVEYLRLNETERPITTLPMSYTYGLSIINTHLYVGASIILTKRSLMEKEFWQQFKYSRATSISGVPYIYEILDKLRFCRIDLPSLRSMTQAGGKLPEELHRRFAEYAKATDKKFFVMYGQTEATARMSYLPAEKALEKCGSIGIAIPGGKFSLINDGGEGISEPDVAGELVYEGPNVTLGYAENGADLSRGDERHGRLATGDIAKRDADGFYYIVGRKKRFLKIYGSRINLDETERLIMSAFDRLDCACAGVDDRMSVYINNVDKCESVRKHLVDKLNIHPSAFCVIALEKLPRNDAGKVLYKDLE